MPFGNGTRCVGGPALQRLPLATANGNRAMRHSVYLTSPPAPSGQISPGSTWHFQCWFRDPAAGGAAFNSSSALSLTFQT